MNNNDDRISPQPSSNQALEARIVTWIMGEASDFEVAELARAIAENPELAAFKTRTEATHRLIREAAAPEQKPLRLSGQRRAALLASLGVSSELTDVNESSAVAGVSKTSPAQSRGVPAAAAPDAASLESQKASEKSSVLTYPMAHRRANTGAWFRALSIACSLMLTFVVLHVTVFAPKPFSREQSAAPQLQERDGITMRKSRQNEKLAAAEFAKRRANNDKMKHERAARDPALVQLPSTPEEKESASKRPFADTEKSGASAPHAADPVEVRREQENTDSTAESFSSSPITDAPIRLEPFDVKATEDSGSYSANSTLAGTRIRSEIPTPNFGKFLSDSRAKTRSTGIDPQRESNSVVFNGGASSGGMNGTPGQNTERKSFLSELSPKAEQKDSSSSNVGSPNDFEGSAPSISQAPTSNRDESIVLSPFVVSDADSPGRESTNSTLAGTRVRTDLKDVASSISVVSQDFLKDTGATNAKDPSDYTPSAEIGGTRVPPSDANLSDAPLAQNPVDKHAKKKSVTVPAAMKPAVPAKADSTDEQSAQAQPVSTFSLHVSDVSFRLAADQIANGEKPDPSTIRPEEFYNAFDYGDPAPAVGEKVNCRIEQSAHPTKQQRNLLRIAMRVPSTGRATTRPLRLTILLDTSGSMQRRDRSASVKDAITSLISLLTPSDRITLVGFSRTPRLLAESVSGDDAQRILSILSQTPPEGGTNFDAALTLAGELAVRQQRQDALNRIVLITDGAANLGDADPKQLSTKIEMLRQKGIAFDACGVGTSGVDDAMLETLTRHGDGRYLLLDRASASAEFAKQLAGAFRPAAKNVKVQVRFNPNRVAHYRLLGFAQHRLKEEDFRNDKVDAAELAADEAATALYEVEPLTGGEGALGEVFVRFQDVTTGEMVERSWTLPYEAKAATFDRAPASLQLAGSAALIAEYLAGENVNLDDLVAPINQLRDRYRNAPRVQTLITMFDQLRRIERRP